MTNIFHMAKAALIEELQRFQNRHFLEAAMAASALLAMADDEIRLSENLALDYALENVAELKIYDVHQAINLFHDYVKAIREDKRKGKEKVFKAITKFAGDEHTASLLIRVCILIAKSDGEFSEQEKEVTCEFCHALNIETSKICALS